MRWISRLGTAMLVSLPVVAGAQAAGGGGGANSATITGRVVDRSTQQPVAGATVRIIGTSRAAQTSEQGVYRLTNAPAGSVTVQAIRLGYAASSRPVTVVAAQTATLDFTLETAATQLDVVQVTATGQEQSRRESGVSTATISVPDQVPQAAVTNLQTVLSSRAAGVTVQEESGTTGAGARIRIRGSNSVSLPNDPLIIVDGVRVNNNTAATSIGVGGQVTSRLNDMNPEEIDNIEVIRGPAAAALYGTAAANGVIQITTKRGRAGRTKWNARSEYGSVREVTNYPANFNQLDLSSFAPDTVYPCTLDFQIRGICNAEKLASFNPLMDNSPFTTGWRERFGLDASGGSDAAQYFVGGDYSREQGVYAINRQRQISLRGNLHGQLRDNVDVSVQTGYVQTRLRTPQNDNNVRGIIPGGLLGCAFRDCNVSPKFPQGMGGYQFDTPADIMGINTQNNTDRFTGSVRTTYQPLTWLSAIGTAGIDFANRLDQEVIPPASAGVPTSGFADDNVGKRTSNPFQDFVYTANASATATFNPRPTLRSATQVGVQFNDEITRATFAFGQNLLAGTGSLGGATALFAVGETNVENKTVGGLISEQLSWREKLFVTGALRGDKNSAFGQDFRKVIYPAAQASWVIGEEGFFPRQDYVSSLRLRTAYGESGQRPAFRTAVRFLTPAAVGIRQPGNTSENVPGFFVGGIGNQALKPELSKEWEIGFDMGFLRDRIGTEVTYYSKKTQDAIIARQIPLSEGEATTRLENIGKVKNAGLEYSVNANIYDSRTISASLLVAGSRTENKLLALGEGIPPIIFGADNVQRHQVGLPLGAYFTTPIASYKDLNGDGIISRTNCPTVNGFANPQSGPGNPLPACEVTLGNANGVYLGTPFPRSEVSFTPQIVVMKQVTVRALFDHRGGQKLLNFTERFRCVSFGNCLAANDKSAPLADQARYVAGLMGSDAGYIEDASFTKFRELSVGIGIPQRYLARTGFTGATLTLAGRNLKTWTNYTGLDPEINENGGLNFSTDEFLTQPHVRYYTVRIDVQF